MMTLIMLFVSLIVFFVCWHYADKSGSWLAWLCAVASGVITFIYVMMWGGML